MTSGGGKCFCPSCFSGNLCQTSVPGCINNCKNGGDNTTGGCECGAGLIGPLCETCKFFCFFFFFFFFDFFFFFLKKKKNKKKKEKKENQMKSNKIK